MKLNQPRSCAGQGYHLAVMKVSILKNGFDSANLSREYECYVSAVGWEKTVAKIQARKRIRALSVQ